MDLLVCQFAFSLSLSGQTGMGLFIHDSVLASVKRRHDLESENVESMWIEYRFSVTGPATLIGFVYRNPASPLSWYDDFVLMMDNVQKCNTDFILLGDFNIDLLKRIPDSWESIMSLFGLHQIISQPTRTTPTSSTLLDHIYTNNVQMVSGVAVDDVCISDHCPITCTLLSKIPKSKHKGHKVIQFRSFKHFDQNAFLYDLHRTDFTCVYNCNDANDALNSLYDTFIPIVDKHAPIRRKRVKHPTLPGWLSSEIMNAMRVRDNLKKEGKFIEYKQQRNKVTQLVRNAKKAYFQKMIENNNGDTAIIWRAMNALTNKSRKSSPDLPTSFTADMFNNYFLSVASSVVNNSSPPSDKFQITPALAQFCRERLKPTDSCTIPEMAVHEVGKCIMQLKNKKSMGSDNLNAFLLKTALPYIVEPLTYIYNLCINQGVFPRILKQAKVIPLPKTKDMNDLSNFRPISLLSILSKPLERHIYTHVAQFAEDANLFHKFQSGFRSKHSCHTALVRLCDTWLSAINKSQLTGAVFLDLRKAFDLVDHVILLHKLELYLQNTHTVSLIKSFLQNRTQKVFLDGQCSQEGPVLCGVPQGSILGPLLFCLFINDLPIRISNDDVNCDLFADDSSLHTSSKNIETVESSLQHSLNEVFDWCTMNRMVLHPKKTKAMVITSRQKHQLQPLTLKLQINNETVEQVSNHRVLGIMVDQELRWHVHINNVCKRVSQNLYLLNKLTQYVNVATRKLFFHAHCLSYINYASTVWSGANETHLKRLNSLYRRAAKIILTEQPVPTTLKLKKLGLLTLQQHFEFNAAVLVFKTQTGSAPTYLDELLLKPPPRYGSNRYIVPRPRIDIYKSSFAFRGSSIWNSLPPNIKAACSVTAFKKNLRSYFLSLT